MKGKWPFLLVAALGLFSSVALPALAQAPADTLLTVPMFEASLGANLPGGDYAKRFGRTYELGAGFWLKTKSRWLLGLEYSYQFSDDVRERVLDSISVRANVSAPNLLIGSDNQFADVRITGRGYKFPILKVGRVWPARWLPGAGANAGVFAALGAGFWQHKINFEDVSRSAPQLAGDYVKGYDRLTNGLALTQDIGYLYLSSRRRINFFVNLQVTEGLTKNRRSWDFMTQQRDTRQRLDLLFGVRVGWLFAVYKKLPNAYYYD